MTPEQFCYWMQGFVEITNKRPTDAQWDIIKDHINLVFDKKTPNRSITKDSLPSQFDLSKYPINVEPNRVTC